MYFELIKNNRIRYSLRVLRNKHLYQKERQFLNQRDYNFKLKKLEKEEQIKSKQAEKKTNNKVLGRNQRKRKANGQKAINKIKSCFLRKINRQIKTSQINEDKERKHTLLISEMRKVISLYRDIK